MRALFTATLLSCMAVGVADASPSDMPLDGRFDVGGRSIRLSCSGSGSPVVVMDAGMGTAPVEDEGWRRIASRVQTVTRVCLHDRAGLGGSDPAPAGARSSMDAVRDLHAALAAAKVDGPFLLVGHSVGGLHVQTFAAAYPNDVAGMVLVSPTHPDQFATWLALLPPAEAGEEKPLAEARAFLTNMQSDWTLNEEHLDMRASAAQAHMLTSLGDRPLIVLTHSPRFRMVPGLSEPLAVKLEDATQRMQRGLLSLSTNAHQEVAERAGHGLPHEAPDFVIAGILRGVAAIRRSEAAGAVERGTPRRGIRGAGR